ncbi:hypothetical protein D4S03_10370 [bacterium]|nr:MAG: hypothetical protein D4S03_10370 [bacterium]
MNKNSLKKLKSSLPKGSAEVIRTRLTLQGHSFSKQYIYRVLDPDHPDYNQIIIEGAIVLIEEDKMQKRALHQRIGLLKKAV